MGQALWRARGVVAALVARELRSRYVGSAIGAVWAVVHPLAQLAIFTFVFSVVLDVRFGQTGRPFVVYLACGLLPWLAIQETLLRSATSVVENAVLVKRVVFPVEVLPVQVALSALLNQAIGLTLVLGLMAAYGITPGPALVLLPVLVMIQLLLMIGLGWMVAALHVYFRDTAQILAVVLPMWFYLTPIIYPYEMVPVALRPLLAVNPLTALVESYRDLFLRNTIPLGAGEVWLALVSATVFCGGAAVFERARGEFADLV